MKGKARARWSYGTAGRVASRKINETLTAVRGKRYCRAHRRPAGDFAKGSRVRGSLTPCQHWLQSLSSQRPVMEYKRPLKTNDASRMTVPAAVTLEMPLMRIFIAAGSLTKLSVADHSTSAPVSKKKPNWTAPANQVKSLRNSSVRYYHPP